MMQLPRSLAVPLAAGAVIAVAFAPPAVGQIDPGELGQLEQRRDEIVTQLATLDARLIELTTSVAELEDAVGVDEARIELVADDIERVVDARREPQATRVEIALIGFTQGDPTQNGILDEIRTLEGDDEPARRRVLYESVIDDTTERLAEIDRRLGELAADLTGARDELAATRDRLATTEEDLDATGTLRSLLAVELQDTLNRIDELRALRNRAVLTGLSSFEDPTRPALAVKIDNVGRARPQAGINQADIVFVELVEGGLTRLAAVFHSTGADVVGPVRSMRTGDFDLLSQFNGPLFSNSGGNRGARAVLESSTLVDIGVGVEEAFDLYYRERSRRAPHNLFTNAYNLWAIGSGFEGTGTPSPMFRFRGANESAHPDAVTARRVDIDYGDTRVVYEWNGSSWDRSQDGGPTVDANGVRTSPTTVIVQFTDYAASSADARSPEAITVGGGRAWIFTDGGMVDGRWRRNDISDQTEYVDGAGNPIPILAGRTWIELPKRDDAIRS